MSRVTQRRAARLARAKARAHHFLAAAGVAVAVMWVVGQIVAVLVQW